MSSQAWLQLAVFLVLLAAAAWPLGRWLVAVAEGRLPGALSAVVRAERGLYRLAGVDAEAGMGWKAYALGLIAFNALGVLAVYVLQRLQGLLPLNPQALPAVNADSAFNTAVSFATNTNWQSYAGESTLSHLSQMAALGFHNFTSAAVGIGVALALARGLTRKPGPYGDHCVGNLWVDLIRSLVYVLVPLSLLGMLFFVSQGMVQSLSAPVAAHTLDGVPQLIPMGPVASQEVIKQLGTNGGGFFNVNSAHPFENPTPLTNFVALLLVFLLPAALTYTYGKMAGDTRQGWALFGAMLVLFVVGLIATTAAEQSPNPAFAGFPIDHAAGNMEGKEVRFGVFGSALFATVTTAASCGAVNAMHDSFTPLGGLIPLVNIQLGEVIFGGVGSGLYGMLIFAVLAVFIAGLLVGRTPEYLGKKIEAKEMTLAMLYVLIFPLVVLGLSAWAATSADGLSALGSAGPHGLTEILYAFSSAVGNNGSAFAGLSANAPFWNLTLGVAMLLGRYFMIIPVLALSGSMIGKKTVPKGPGTFPTGSLLFVGLLIGVIVILGALTFFPALSLGPLAEHFAAQYGKVY